MKFCPKCGEKLKKGEKACPKCSKKEVKKTTKKEQKPKQGFVIAGLVIGIISIILSFILSIFILPLAALGLIFAICGTGKKGKKVAGIVTNSVAIFIAVVMAFVWTTIIFASTTINSGVLDGIFGSNKTEGKWYCKVSTNTTTNDYTLTLNFNENKNFSWKDYKNPTTNYVYGTYTYKTIKETTPDGKYYNEVTLRPTTMYLYGRARTTKASTIYKMYITKKIYPRKAKLINKTTYNTYYCEEK